MSTLRFFERIITGQNSDIFVQYVNLIALVYLYRKILILLHLYVYLDIQRHNLSRCLEILCSC